MTNKLAAGSGADDRQTLVRTIVNVYRMSHRNWREIKQQLIRLPDLALLGCSLVSLHILCDILPTFTVSSPEIHATLTFVDICYYKGEFISWPHSCMLLALSH